MSEIYFSDWQNLNAYLKSTLEMQEDDIEDFDLENLEEESFKRSTLCSGMLHDSVKDIYYSVSFTSDYDWGPSDYYIDPTPRKKIEWEETVIVKKVKYTPV